MHIDAGQLRPVRAERLHGHPPGRGDRVLRLHRVRRDLDRGGGDAEPAAQPADRHPRRARDLHGHLRHRRRRADRDGAVQQLGVGRSAGARARARGLPGGRLDRGARRRRLDGGGAARVSVRPAAHLLLDGARRPAAAVGREDPPDARASRTSRRCSPASSWRSRSLVGDAAETYDLTNIGTLFAFVLVCIGVLVLRVKEPDRPRPFRVPFVWVVAPLGAAACLFIMVGLPGQAWERFAIWLAIGLCCICLRVPAFSRLHSADASEPDSRRSTARLRTGSFRPRVRSIARVNPLRTI